MLESCPILLGSTHWCYSYRIKAWIIVLAVFICTAVLPTVELLCLKTSYSQLHRFSGLILRRKFVGRVLALTIGGSRSTCKLKFGQDNGWHFLLQVGNEGMNPSYKSCQAKRIYCRFTRWLHPAVAGTFCPRVSTRCEAIDLRFSEVQPGVHCTVAKLLLNA